MNEENTITITTTGDMNVNENKNNNKEEVAFEKKEESAKTLDSLFMKTTTLPHIYYLPLTEEQVKEKMKNQNRK